MKKSTKLLLLCAAGLALAYHHNGGANPMQLSQPAKSKAPAAKKATAKQTAAQLKKQAQLNQHRML